MAGDECALLPAALAVWHGHVAMVVGKLMGGFPQKAAGSNPAGGTSSDVIFRVAGQLSGNEGWVRCLALAGHPSGI